MPVVRMPNGDLVSFPDDMPDNEVRGFIVKHFPNAFEDEKPTITGSFIHAAKSERNLQMQNTQQYTGASSQPININLNKAWGDAIGFVAIQAQIAGILFVVIAGNLIKKSKHTPLKNARWFAACAIAMGIVSTHRYSSEDFASLIFRSGLASIGFGVIGFFVGYVWRLFRPLPQNNTNTPEASPSTIPGSGVDVNSQKTNIVSISQASLRSQEKRKFDKGIIFSLIALPFILWGFYAALSGGKKSQYPEVSSYSAPVKVAGTANQAKYVYYALPEFIVKLNTDRKHSNFLRATVILELSSMSDSIVVEKNIAHLNDVVTTYVQGLRPSDLSGRVGIVRLRQGLLLRINSMLEPIKVNNVLFKDIAVQ